MAPVAYIVEAVRTAGGRKNGRLRDWEPADLAGEVLKELVRRSGINPADIDDVILGCVDEVGSQSMNIGRTAVLAAGLPESVPGTTVNRMCGSSQQAVHFAAQAVMSGVQDIVIACGVENMTKVPINAAENDGHAAGHGRHADAKGVQARYGKGIEFSQFTAAELVASKYGVSRAEIDSFAAASHSKALNATKNGYFKREILPIKGSDPKTGAEVIHDTDEGIRAGTTVEALAKLPALKKGGIITAGSASQICDGAAGILICNEAGLKKLGKNARPRAKIHTLALAGTDPVVMLHGPIPATQNALKKAGLSIKDIDLYEINEAFGSIPLAWAKEVGADINKLNVNGGAQALGHPLGATGCKIMTTLLYELERRNGRFGLQAICEGGGTANCTIIERIPEADAKKIIAKL
ncbi:acetyl-CoA acetyltransferase [Gonapodya prolifera JEL478]|uniref:Acetyl-CoA acetyltransferase n=1 Tax=Gonapodya prolifera (strain JEL478) TaxID=1344416 RepID=A0A139AM07_GONPJ|nr:acetyl-CoA acetyltransferase [Gonapodya prolifera JEL478]|eukprot:KXS17594.1 acetyl-CoA acetyltransferase [Gonapodya prolifera JEL478]